MSECCCELINELSTRSVIIQLSFNCDVSLIDVYETFHIFQLYGTVKCEWNNLHSVVMQRSQMIFTLSNYCETAVT